MTTKPRSGAANVEEQNPDEIPEAPDDKTAEAAPVDTVRLRLVGLPNISSFAYPTDDKHIVITQEGEDVPADKAEAIIASAEMSGLQIVRDFPPSTGEEA